MTTVSLKWTDSEGHEQFFPLSTDEILIGRKSDADIILANASVSRHHAKLVRSQEGYSIIDLSNTNGTYVNGQRIRQQRLHHGDRICLGQDRTQLSYLTDTSPFASPVLNSEADNLEKSLASLTSILPQHSDLEKISSILDFQYQWGKVFSAESTFEQILKATLKISGAERGYILLKQQDRFRSEERRVGKGCRSR